MFKRGNNYQRRYNSVVGIDKISYNTEDSKGIDSYKPSKSSSIADTLIGSVGDDEFFNNKSSCDYANDMDLLHFNNSDEVNIAIDVKDEVEESVSTLSNEKNTNLLVLVGLALGVLVTVIVHILM